MATFGVTVVVARVWLSFQVWKPIGVVFGYFRKQSNAIGGVLNAAVIIGVIAIALLGF